MLGVSSQGLTGSSCLSSFEDREKAFLSTVDRSREGEKARASALIRPSAIWHVF